MKIIAAAIIIIVAVTTIGIATRQSVEPTSKVQPETSDGPVRPRGKQTAEDMDWNKRGRNCSLSLNTRILLPPWVCEGGIRLLDGHFLPNEDSAEQILRDLESANKAIEDKFGCTPPAQDMTKTMTGTTLILRYTIGCGDVIYHVRKYKTTGQFKAAKSNPRLVADQLDWK